MHKFYLTLAIVSLALPLFSAERVMLNIHLSNGTVQSVELYTRPQVRFDGDRVVFSSPVANFSYEAQQVLTFTYSGGSLPTKVVDPKSQELFKQNDERIIFDAKVTASSIKLISEDGKLVRVDVTSLNGHPSISLKEIPKGVYVLSVDGQTSKIIKK